MCNISETGKGVKFKLSRNVEEYVEKNKNVIFALTLLRLSIVTRLLNGFPATRFVSKPVFTPIQFVSALIRLFIFTTSKLL